ncbi:MAG: hypothetical protein U1A78_35810 [Polyangia bacterium]
MLFGAVLLAAGCSSSSADSLLVRAPVDADPTKLEPFMDIGLPRVSLTEIDCPSEPGASAVAVANLDGDPALDLVIGRSVGSTLAVGLNAGRGCPRESTYLTDSAVSSLALADSQAN